MSQYDDDPEEGYDDDTDTYDYSNDPNVEAVEDEPRSQKKTETVIPIGEAVTPETLHGVVAFTRSLNLGTKDNNAHYRVEIPFVVQPQWTIDQVGAQAASAFNLACGTVLQQAGLPMAVDEDGILREVVKRFDGAQQVQAPRRREEDRGDRSRDRDEDQGNFPHPADMRRPEHVNRDIWEDLCQNYEDWYDNRGDKASGQAFDSSPDFKRKDDGKGLWLRPFRRENSPRGGDRHGSRSGRN